jgi:glycosyltransferase involved in cell wall biosynthesis
MKIGFVSEWDLNDPIIRRRAFSGILNYMLKAFEEQGDSVELIGPILPTWKARLIRNGIEVLNRVRVFSPKAYGHYHPWVLDEMAGEVKKRLAGRYDILLSQATIVMAHVDVDIPIVYWRDANYEDLRRTYAEYKNRHPRSDEWAHKHERRAMATALLNLFSSECSYETATSYYGIPSHKVFVVPFGANHEFIPEPEVLLKTMVQKRERDHCRLLFIGYAWQRKGGDFAVAVCKAVNDMGISATLDVVGAVPTIVGKAAHFVTVHGSIDKETKEGAASYRRLCERAHFLVHPAKAEAFGCALAEACSFGVPCVGTRVGGIPTIIKDQRNGKIFPLDASPCDYARYIIDTFRNVKLYEDMAMTAAKEFLGRLNWRTAVARARELIEARL